ncbi:MAG: hypothetical protein EOO65_01340 [Methanosarcinales archaeon]|nr:MAG: hypothetical protein EOO65_01340 [Methanosarcinales archaeon]
MPSSTVLSAAAVGAPAPAAATPTTLTAAIPAAAASTSVGAPVPSPDAVEGAKMCGYKCGKLSFNHGLHFSNDLLYSQNSGGMPQSA